MVKHLKWVVSFFLVGACSTAIADESGISKFRDETYAPIMLCELKGKGLVLTYKLGDSSKIKETSSELRQCVLDAESRAKKAYPKARLEAKKKNAEASLKKYYATWLSSIRSLDIEDEDTESSYSRRVADNKTKVNEAWAEVEIDAGL